MKTITTVFLTAAVALGLLGCGAPANNAPIANTNTNTAPKAPSAPTADDLLKLEKQANEAYTKGDSKFFEAFLGEKFAMEGMNGKPVGKAEAVKMIGGVKCDVKSFDMTEPQMSKIDNDTYVIVAKATWDGTCNDGPGGKDRKIQSPMRTASIYTRSGDKWVGAWHAETPIMEPKDDKKADANSKPEAKKDDAAKPADTKKEEPKKEEPKKDEPKKDDKAASNSASNTAESKPAPLTPDANTDALTKIHQGGWEAWRDKDAKKLGDMTAANLAFVDAGGGYHSPKDDVIKFWTDAEACKDVKNVKVSDGFAVALSPTVELFFSKGTADGTCEGHKNGSLYGTGVYVKEGNDWKLAFLFESPAMSEK